VTRRNREALQKIARAISKVPTIGIFPHIGVDGDCLGSSLALKSALDLAGHRTVLFVDSSPPSRFDFMPGIREITVYPDAGESCDFAILIDCSNPSRIGRCAEIYEKIPIKAIIDHHQTGECSEKLCCIDPQVSAAGELVYDFIKILQSLHGRDLLNTSSAFNLYTALFSDTGGFSYANTTARAFKISGELFSAFRIDSRQVAFHLYEKTSISKIKLEGKAYQATTFHHHDQIAICRITRQMMEECNAVDNDVDSICSSLRNIESVVVAFVLREKKSGEIRANIRSSDRFDASAFAARFDGGGHKMAAGFSVYDQDIDTVFDMVLQESIASFCRKDRQSP
jgi:bifunctional oligoribonuclease and PAP phosphatase NrnA